MSVTKEGSKNGMTFAEANDGLIDIASVVGGIGPTIAVLIATVDNVLPADCEFCSVTVFPSGKFSVGASGGELAVLATLSNTGDDKTFNVAGLPNPVVLNNGFFGSKFRIVGAADNIESCIFNIDIQVGSYEYSDFGGTALIDTPQNPTNDPPVWSQADQEGSTQIHFSYPNTSAENPTGFLVQVSKDGGPQDPIASIPWANGVTDYSFTTYVHATGSYSYTIAAYKYTGMRASPLTSPLVVVFSASGVTAIVGDLLFTASVQSTMVFIADPSGIYTVVKGKTHDTLYERLPSVTAVNVKIPDPFAKTAFVP